MSFITPAPVQTPIETPVESDIENDGFFPDISLTDARSIVRIDGTITPERLRHALVEAAAAVNDELIAWKQQQLANGYTKLEEVPASRIDGESVLLARYLRSVFCQAKANLTERYRDYDSTSDGNKRADESETTIDDLRRDARWAISDILGKSRTTVDLI